MIPRDNREPTRDDLVEAEFLESVRNRCPFDVSVLKALGDLYTRVGRVREGLQIDLDLSRLCPRESHVWYNLACSYALAGDADKAIEVLNHAVDLGYDDYEWMGRDEDLAALKGDPRFARIFYRIMLRPPAEVDSKRHDPA